MRSSDQFEWDEKKNQENFRNHKIRFEEAKAIFDRSVWTRIDDRNNYGELREISVGDIGNFVLVTVVHTDRNGRTRIISARKATRRERTAYYDHLARTAT